MGLFPRPGIVLPKRILTNIVLQSRSVSSTHIGQEQTCSTICHPTVAKLEAVNGRPRSIAHRFYCSQFVSLFYRRVLFLTFIKFPVLGNPQLSNQIIGAQRFVQSSCWYIRHSNKENFSCSVTISRAESSYRAWPSLA